jgi:predicted metal-dependent hydrolase
MAGRDISPCTFPLPDRSTNTKQPSDDDHDNDTSSIVSSRLSRDITSDLETDAIIDAHVDADSDLEPIFYLTLQHHNKPLQIPIYHDASTIQDLSDIIAETLHIPPAHQKLLITPKTGLLKPPFKDASLLLSTLRDKKIVLMGATTAEIDELASDIAARQDRIRKRQSALQAARRVQPTKHRSSNPQKTLDDARYTFHTIRPLAYLPDPAKSQRFLERLARDPGIQSAMRRHGFSVGLLTEMNPIEHTAVSASAVSRTLGLNRNRGEVIELRLRTDAYDGYRDYNTIRKTLCHELAHNVWGEHDARFWKLCREIEAEVARDDWRSGGNSVGGGVEFYAAPGDVVDEEADHGGWEGGEYVLGGGGESSSSSSSAAGGEALSRREIIARATEERLRKQKEAKEGNADAKRA